MKLQFVSYDNIDIIKSNLISWVDNFKQDSSMASGRVWKRIILRYQIR